MKINFYWRFFSGDLVDDLEVSDSDIDEMENTNGNENQSVNEKPVEP